MSDERAIELMQRIDALAERVQGLELRLARIEARGVVATEVVVPARRDPRAEPEAQQLGRVRPRKASAPVLAAAVEGAAELAQARQHLDRAEEALERAASAAVRGDDDR